MSWTDQPKEVEQAIVLLHCYVTEVGGVELRKGTEGVCYLSVGNLFGSQTLRCLNVEAALRALQIVYDNTSAGRVHKRLIPTDCVLMENAEEEAVR